MTMKTKQLLVTTVSLFAALGLLTFWHAHYPIVLREVWFDTHSGRTREVTRLFGVVVTNRGRRTALSELLVRHNVSHHKSEWHLLSLQPPRAATTHYGVPLDGRLLRVGRQFVKLLDVIELSDEERHAAVVNYARMMRTGDVDALSVAIGETLQWAAVQDVDKPMLLKGSPELERTR